MKSDIDILKTIDDYLDGALTAAESDAVEARIAQDSDFAALVEETKEVNDALHFSGLASLREKIGADIKHVNHPRKSNSGLKYGLTALILAGGLTTFFVSTDAEKEDKKTTFNLEKEQKQTNITDKKSFPDTRNKNSTEKREPLTIAPNQKEKQQDTKEIKQQLPLQVKDTIFTTHRDTLSEKQPKTEEELPSTTVVAPAIDFVDNPVPVEVICNHSFIIKTTPSCKEKNTGKLSITPSEDGVYKFNLLKQRANDNGIFTNLTTGKYTIEIKENEGCSYIKEAEIGEKWCPLNESYSFNPNYGEKWNIVHEANDSGTFMIYSASGKLIYNGNFGNGEGYWEGIDSQGGIVPMGNYLAIINYNDGKKEKVELTVIR